MRIEGGCYCGEIRYVSNGDAQASVQCHCRECQYITGGHPNVLMIMPSDGFKFNCLMAYKSLLCTGFRPSRTSGSDLEVIVDKAYDKYFSESASVKFKCETSFCIILILIHLWSQLFGSTN